jgi:hypothetical protein
MSGNLRLLEGADAVMLAAIWPESTIKSYARQLSYRPWRNLRAKSADLKND